MQYLLIATIVWQLVSASSIQNQIKAVRFYTPASTNGTSHRLTNVRVARSRRSVFDSSIAVATSTSQSTAVPTFRVKNISRLIDSKLKQYDIRLRPGFGGSALRIGITTEIRSFDAVSEYNMDYTITLLLTQKWQDTRLDYSKNANSRDSLTLTSSFGELIWVPDTFLANDKKSYLHRITGENKLFTLRADGTIMYQMRLTSILACMMDLHNYPMDEQRCTVEIESYGYTMKDLEMYWMNETKTINKKALRSLDQFTLINFKLNSTYEKLSTGTYQRLSLVFLFRRNLGYFILQTFVPSTLIVMLSWVSFWINYEATSARVSLGITTVLTMTTISTGVRASLPRISYVKAIDIFLVMSFVFVFAALIEYALVNYTYWGLRAKMHKNNRALSKLKRLSMSCTSQGQILNSSDCRAEIQRRTTNEQIAEDHGRTSPINQILMVKRNNAARDSIRSEAETPPRRRKSGQMTTSFVTTQPGYYSSSQSENSDDQQSECSQTESQFHTAALPTLPNSSSFPMAIRMRTLQLNTSACLNRVKGNRLRSLHGAGTSSSVHGSRGGSSHDRRTRSKSSTSRMRRLVTPNWLTRSTSKPLGGQKPDAMRKKPSEVQKIDQYSRIIFPVLFSIFNAWFWWFYLSQREPVEPSHYHVHI